MGLCPDRLQAANINPQTGLATDYLNHFNEIIMMLELLPTMPDCMDDVLEWGPLSYTEHFEHSVFADRDLAVEAYRNAKADVKRHFESLVHDIDGQIISIQALVASADLADPAVQYDLNTRIAEELRPRLDQASAIIHGTAKELHDSGDGLAAAQAAIDAMFD